MTQLRLHPSVVRDAEATVAAIFAMPVSRGVRAFIRAYLFSTPTTREALIVAVVDRLQVELRGVRDAARLAA